MRLSHVNFAWMVLWMSLLLTFNCVIFDNTNSVEITLPQSLDRFQALSSIWLPFYGELDGFHNQEDLVFRCGQAWMY